MATQVSLLWWVILNKKVRRKWGKIELTLALFFYFGLLITPNTSDVSICHISGRCDGPMVCGAPNSGSPSDASCADRPLADVLLHSSTSVGPVYQSVPHPSPHAGISPRHVNVIDALPLWKTPFTCDTTAVCSPHWPRQTQRYFTFHC